MCYMPSGYIASSVEDTSVSRSIPMKSCEGKNAPTPEGKSARRFMCYAISHQLNLATGLDRPIENL
jgi:hypothetical protein